jgi:hypothetical protein
MAPAQLHKRSYVRVQAPQGFLHQRPRIDEAHSQSFLCLAHAGLPVHRLSVLHAGGPHAKLLIASADESLFATRAGTHGSRAFTDRARRRDRSLDLMNESLAGLIHW